MENNSFSNIPWCPIQSQSMHIPVQWHSWLLHQNSLMKLLKKVYKNKVEISLIKQSWEPPTSEDRQYLNIGNQRVSIRESLILCDNQPKVFARTTMPEDSLIGTNKCLLSFGCNPISDYLFTQTNCKRHRLEIAIIPAKNLPLLAKGKTLSEFIWARRSLFLPLNKPISICEFFLSPLLQPDNNLREPQEQEQSY